MFQCLVVKKGSIEGTHPNNRGIINCSSFHKEKKDLTSTIVCDILIFAIFESHDSDKNYFE